MAMVVLYFLVGMGLLYFGSEWMVRGASGLALSFNIRPVIVGLTVVAFATSAPELVVSLIAAIKGSSGVSLGNILGSNVANLGLVMGLSAVASPLSVEPNLLRREMPFMLMVTFLFWILCMDGRIGRLDGIILVGCLGAFLTMSVLTAKSPTSKIVVRDRLGKKTGIWYLFQLSAGTLGLVAGANWMVRSAILMARALGLSEVFIGLSIVAVGTSLPELATSVVAGIKGESDISIGNVVGSNIFNICLVIGTVGLFHPMTIESRLLRFEFPTLVVLSCILFVFSSTGKRLNRLEGLFFVLGFCLFVAISFLFSKGGP